MESRVKKLSVILDAKHFKQQLNLGKDVFELQAKIAPLFHRLGVSFCIGPYGSRNSVKPFVTLYVSYFLNDALKIARFRHVWVRYRSNPYFYSKSFGLSVGFPLFRVF